VLNYPATIVLLSDGQNNAAPPPMAIINAAISRGIHIYTVGIGTAKGATVHIRGLTLREVLDEATLKQIAQVTDAQHFNAATEQGLTAVYKNLKTQVVLKTQKLEVTALFTAAAALLTLIAGALSLRWFSRLP
jgi:Ca-activated chloride channel homolog